MIGTNQFKNGTHIEVDGTVFKIVEFQHVKPGKGGAFVRTKLKRADDGAVIDKTFRAGEKFRPVRTESRKMTFLYSDGTDAHFMDTQTYEQTMLKRDTLGDAVDYLLPNINIEVSFFDGKAVGIELPQVVEMTVVETEPGIKSATASSVTKPAKLETGLVVQVPPFINEGEKIRIDTSEGSYMSRA